MRSTVVELYRLKLECKRCRCTWRDAVPQGDRGHILMVRGDCRVFVLDDIVYEAPVNLDELRETLHSLGFRNLWPTCPRCGGNRVSVVRGILTRHVQPPRVPLGATELTAEDFDDSPSLKIKASTLRRLTADHSI